MQKYLTDTEKSHDNFIEIIVERKHELEELYNKIAKIEFQEPEGSVKRSYEVTKLCILASINTLDWVLKESEGAEK